MNLTFYIVDARPDKHLIYFPNLRWSYVNERRKKNVGNDGLRLFFGGMRFLRIHCAIPPNNLTSPIVCFFPRIK